MDIHAFSKNSRRYIPLNMEIDDAFSELMLQIEVLLFTRPGDLLGLPGFGIDLEQYIFESNINTELLRRQIDRKIEAYIITPDDVKVDSNVTTYRVNDEPIVVVDINVNSVKAGSFVF